MNVTQINTTELLLPQRCIEILIMSPPQQHNIHVAQGNAKPIILHK